MTSRAQLGGFHPELGGTRIANAMHPVAVGADGDVRVVGLKQGGPVDALGIALVDVGVAAAAGLRDKGTRLVRGPHIVRPMAIGANRSFEIAGKSDLGVHAVERLIIVVRMTLLA